MLLGTILLNHHINTIIGSYFHTHLKNQESKVQREILTTSHIELVSGRTNNLFDPEPNPLFSTFLHGLPFGLNDIAYSLKINAINGEPTSPSKHQPNTCLYNGHVFYMVVKICFLF